MKEQIKQYIALKKCDRYKINNEPTVSSSYPEDYNFTKKEGSEWIYGESHRDKEKILKEFRTEEEALLALLFELYTSKLSYDINKSYGIKWHALTNNEIINNTYRLFDDEILNDLKVLNEKQLIYKEKYIINNSFYKRTIDDFRLYKIFLLKAFEQTKKELIEYGIDAVELDNYFRFENLVDL